MALLTETLWETPDVSPLKLILKGKYYTLNQWPNFGSSRYAPEYIQICAYLGRGYLSKKEVLSATDVDEQLLDYFLNTAHLLGILDVISHPAGSTSQAPSSISRFTHKLKQLFNFR